MSGEMTGRPLMKESCWAAPLRAYGQHLWIKELRSQPQPTQDVSSGRKAHHNPLCSIRASGILPEGWHSPAVCKCYCPSL